MKTTISVVMLAILALSLLSGCASPPPELDYHESFTVTAFNQLNGKLGYSKGYTLMDARYAYVTNEHLTLPDSAFEGCTERQRYYFSQIYCCIELTIMANGITEKHYRYFSVSSYDFTPELEGKACLDLLKGKLSFERTDIGKIKRYLS
ncbi:MAG: hypothetical protein IKK58_04400 [Clostridia bacterium]|nr:hypothetical protein [Clostridia bacterium]